MVTSEKFGIQGSSLQVADVVTGGLLLLSLVIRLALLIGPVGSDDLNYFHYAQKLLHWDEFSELHHHGGRLVFLAIIGLPAAAVGSIFAGAVANVLMLSARDIFVVWYLRKRCGAVAAASGAGILGFNALSTTYAGVMLPDGLLSWCMFMSAVCAYESIQAFSRKRFLLVIAGGVLAGAAYSVKDTGILIVPSAIAWIVLADNRWKKVPGRSLGEAGLYLGAFALFVLLEMSVYYALSGDALYRIHAISLTHNTTGDVVAVSSLYDFARSTYWNAFAVTRWSAASLPVLLVAGVVWSASILRRTRFAFFSLTGVFLTFYLIFGSSSLTRAIPLPVQDRYFEIIVPFLAVAAAGWMGHYAKQASHRALSLVCAILLPVLLALLSVPAIVVNAGDLTFSSLGKNAAIAIGAVRHAEPNRPVHVSPRMYRVLELFIAEDIRKELVVIPDAGPLPAGFYILHPWLDTLTKYQRTEDIADLRTYIAVDEDHRIFQQLAPTKLKREIVVKYVE